MPLLRLNASPLIEERRSELGVFQASLPAFVVFVVTVELADGVDVSSLRP